MILLRRDCLVFETSDGQNIPCSVAEVTIELLGDAVHCFDKELIKNAATGVLHYFKEELGRTSVSLAEFSLALEQALGALGLKIQAEKQPATKPSRVAETDLLQLAFQSGKGCELFFFPSLREEMRRNLDLGPEVLRFRGLRVCVKQLTGSKRWTRRCQVLQDQIVDYLRTCLGAEKGAAACALVVS